MHFGIPVLNRDRAIVLSGLALVSGLAWLYLSSLSDAMKGIEFAMPQMQPWGILDLVLSFAMWAVMMVAVMVPSATPMLLTFATINRRRREQKGPFVPTGVFLAGYLVVWTGFSAVAALAQWALHAAALLSPTMVGTSPILGGALLLAAGIYQWTPLKQACLTHCRSPLGFLMTEWREGTRGALMMGVKHGSYCLGCCWVLMSLLFVTGVMNLLWIAVITSFVLMEKVAPLGPWMSRAAGLILIGLAAGAVS